MVKEVVSFYLEEVQQTIVQVLAVAQSSVDCQQLVELLKTKKKKHTIQLAITKDVRDYFVHHVTIVVVCAIE